MQGIKVGIIKTRVIARFNASRNAFVVEAESGEKGKRASGTGQRAESTNGGSLGRC